MITLPDLSINYNGQLSLYPCSICTIRVEGIEIDLTLHSQTDSTQNR